MYIIYNFVAGDVITISAQHEFYFVNQTLVLRAHRNHIALKKKDVQCKLLLRIQSTCCYFLRIAPNYFVFLDFEFR